jgi:hypothetical protein
MMEPVPKSGGPAGPEFWNRFSLKNFLKTV